MIMECFQVNIFSQEFVKIKFAFFLVHLGMVASRVTRRVLKKSPKMYKALPIFAKKNLQAKIVAQK
jgi:hypothetical protein